MALFKRTRVERALLGGIIAAAAGGFMLGGGASAQEAPCGYAPVAAEIEGPTCSISVDKEVWSEDSSFVVGDEVTFRITATNTGTVWLYDVGIVDEYDSDLFSYVGSDVDPTEQDHDLGLVAWDAVDEGEGLAPGDDLAVFVTLEIAGTGEKVENCAFSYATAATADVYESEGGVDVDSGDFDCARIDVTAETGGGGGGPTGPRPFPTATPIPTSTPVTQPTPVNTVAGATAVATKPAGITLPDTGTGVEPGGAGIGAGVLAIIVAVVCLGFGAATLAVRSSHRR